MYTGPLIKECTQIADRIGASTGPITSKTFRMGAAAGSTVILKGGWDIPSLHKKSAPSQAPRLPSRAYHGRLALPTAEMLLRDVSARHLM